MARIRRSGPRQGRPDTTTATATVAGPGAYGCRVRGGCTPGDRCPEHRDAQPERIGDLAAALIAALRPDRPRLRLITGGRR